MSDLKKQFQCLSDCGITKVKVNMTSVTISSVF